MAEKSAALIQDTLDLVVPATLKLSPKGSQVVYSTRLKWNHRKGQHTTASIWIAETDTEKSARPLTDGLFNDRMPCWSPDGRSVAFVSDRGAQGRACAIYVIGVDGHDPRVVTPENNERYITSVEFSPDGKALAFVAPAEKSSVSRARDAAREDAIVWGRDWDYAHLWLLDIESGTIRMAFGADVHVTGFAWNDTGSEIAVTTHRTPHAESVYLHGTTLSILEPATAQVRKVFHFPREMWKIAWSGTDLYFIANNMPTQDTSGMAVYKVAEEQNYQKVAHGEADCAQDLAAAGTKIVVHAEHGPEDRLLFLDGGTLLCQKKKIVAFDLVCGRHTVLVYSEGDVNHPTEVFCSTDDGKALQLSDHGTAFAGKQFGHCCFLECASLDGEVSVDGLFLVPRQYSGSGRDGMPMKPLPTLVIIHGGPYCRNTDAFDIFDPHYILIQSLLLEGFGVLVPNYRGSSGKGEKFASYARGGVGTYDEPDIVAMVQHSIDLGYADKTRLVVAGWSEGGHLAYLSAVRNGTHGFGWRYRGIVAGAGVTDWDSMALMSDVGYMQAQHAGGSPWTLQKEDTKTRNGSALWGFKEALRDGRIPPMLILHGDTDSRVPISQAHGFRRALDEAGMPFEFVTYPREGHYFRERKHIEDLASRILRFVRLHTS